MQTSDTQATASAQINKPLLKQGARGEAVRELQTLLANLAVYTGTIDGIFTQEVKNAVIAFQHRVFLVEDGIVGSLTWQALYKGAPVNMPVLKQGSKGKTVLTLQRLLKTSNDYTGAIDGEFGLVTKQAVETFQKRLGLVVDGIVGDRTWEALSKVPH